MATADTTATDPTHFDGKYATVVIGIDQLDETLAENALLAAQGITRVIFWTGQEELARQWLADGCMRRGLELILQMPQSANRYARG
jgi:hypothetical protein